MNHNAEEEKARNKQLKEDAKAAKAEEKRLAKEEHAVDEHPHPEEKAPEATTTSSHKRRLSRPFTPKIQTKSTSSTTAANNNNGNTPRNEASPLSPATSPDSATESAAGRVKNWLRSRLHKPRAKSVSVIKSGSSNKTSDSKSTHGGVGQQGGFIGGHALTRFHHADGTGSMTSLSEGPTPLSMREVALAGRRPLSSSPPLRHHYQTFSDEAGESSQTANHASRRSHGRVASNPASFASSGSGSSTIELVERNHGEGEAKRESRARDRTKRPEPLDMGIMPPRALVDPAGVTPRSSKSPNRDSKFIEIIE